MASLSGGERARLLLNMVAMEKPHLLILDEPTNHLDIDSRRALLDALNDYEGAVMLITHDRSLMELVADRLWLAADGTIKPFDGDMDDYAKSVLERARSSARAANKAAVAPPPEPVRTAPAGQAGPLKRKLEAAELALARANAAVAEIDTALSDPRIYVEAPARVAELTEKRARAAERLAKAEAEWIAAAEAFEAVGA